MPIKSMFATEIFFSPLAAGNKLRKLNGELAREAYIFRKLDNQGVAWSKTNYKHGYTSYSSLVNLPERSPHFLKLKLLIDKQVKEFANRQDWDLQGGELRMTNCWINIMDRHSHHSFHLHPHSVISGTYYVATPKGSGLFKVEDPRIQCLMAAPPRIAKSRKGPYLSLRPKEGHVVLFESWLKHEVTPNESDSDRISVSFNYEWFRT